MGTGSAGDAGLPDIPDVSADAGGDGGFLEDTGRDAGDFDTGVVSDGGVDAGVGDAGDRAPWFRCRSSTPPSGDNIATVFNKADQYFTSTDDRRNIRASAKMPYGGPWAQIRLRLQLDCPADNVCDKWDRLASLSLVLNPGEAGEELLELERYVTPFGIGMCFETDVTRYSSLLNGTRTFSSFIDTWVGPTTKTYGHGWRVTLSLVFVPGQPSSPEPRIYNLLKPVNVVIGDPAKPIVAQAPIADLYVEAPFSRAEIRGVFTGHGQGNLDNCGEFCQLMSAVIVNGTVIVDVPWRGDCDTNPNGSKQGGTWEYARNGWCPGAYAIPWLTSVTELISLGSLTRFSMDVLDMQPAPYLNSCRPGAGGPSNTCEGCVFNLGPGNCDYNGGDHTEPNIFSSMQLFVYP
jgi:hypothetical protein